MHLPHLLSSFTVAGADPYMPGQMPSGGMQDMYGRPPSALSMSQRSQYPYGPGYDRRYVHQSPENLLYLIISWTILSHELQGLL